MKYNLSDICDYAKGKIDVNLLDENTYISTENMLPNKSGITRASSLPSIAQTQAFLAGDVLVSNIRPYFKKIWFAGYDGGCSNDVLVFRAKEGVSKRFLYYVLANDTFFDYSMVTSKGTKMPRGDKTAIMKYEVPSFTYEEQETIAGILESLDRKIQINTEINDNLSQQSDLIFYNMFGQYYKESIIPPNWTLTELGNIDVLITDYVANGSFKSLADNVQYLDTETNNVLIRLTDFNNNFDGDMVYISDDSYEFLSKSMLYGDEIIISNVGANVGTVFRCPRLSKRMSLGPNAVLLRSKKYEHYLYLLFKSSYGQGLLQSIVTGSAQPKFNKTNFRALKILVPDDKTLSIFNETYAPMFEKITVNNIENNRLSKTRDTLLPKLMSGELDISNIDI